MRCLDTLCSLQPHVDRALSRRRHAGVEAGVLKGAAFYPAVMRFGLRG